MLAGPLIFVDIDTQRDFLEPSGSLFIYGSQVIRPILALLTKTARSHGIPVIATACAHTLDEEDPEPFPPHCLVGTEGKERIAETAWKDGVVLSPNSQFPSTSALPSHLTLEKTRYDLFSRADATEILARYAKNRPTFAVYGVATDYCVRAVVLGLRALDYRVAVVVDAVWAIDQAHEVDQFAEFVERGAVLIHSEVVCG